MKKTLLSVLFVLLVSTNVYCEPSKTTQTLMNTPMSMLDWGLYKTTLFYTNVDGGFGQKYITWQLKEIFSNENIVFEDSIFAEGVCFFDWKINRIVIKINIMVFKKELLSNKKLLKQLCKTTTEVVRNGEDENNFMQDGFVQTNYPSKTDIKNHIKIKVCVITYDDKEKLHLSSESDKNSDKILYSE